MLSTPVRKILVWEVDPEVMKFSSSVTTVILFIPILLPLIFGLSQGHLISFLYVFNESGLGIIVCVIILSLITLVPLVV